MRYSEIDLQCEDIMWFGVDTSGHILAFTSGGCGSVPEFVCRSKEETEKLEEYFLEKLSTSSECKMEIPNDGTPLAVDAQMLSKKGVFVYDVSFEDSHKDEYIIIARPTLPISINCLPAHIASILNDHIVECGEVAPKYLRVKHAY